MIKAACNNKSSEGGNKVDVRCAVFGDGLVGKTTLLDVCRTGIYPGEYILVVDYYDFNLVIDEKSVDIIVTDPCHTGCYEETYLHLSAHNANVLIIMFSVVDPISFANTKTKWYPLINNLRPKAPILLVGCKTDLRAGKDVTEIISSEQGEQMVKELEMVTKYMECSAMNQTGMKEIFEEAARLGSNYASQSAEEKEEKRCILC